jgi:hypothetical protein
VHAAILKIVHATLISGYDTYADTAKFDRVPTSRIALEHDTLEFQFHVDGTSITPNSASVVFSTWGDIDALCHVVSTWCSGK